MEMLAQSELSEQRSSYVAAEPERYRMRPLDKHLEAQTVDIIRRTILHLPEGSAELGATRRKLNDFYSSYVRNGSIYLVLFDETAQRVVGGVGVVPFAGLDPSEGIGEIRELTVDKPYRRNGFGLQLLQAAFDTAMDLRYQRLYLETTEQMNPAQALFLRFGFRPVAQHQQETRRRHEPLIRQAGQPSFYVWEADGFKGEPELQRK